MIRFLIVGAAVCLVAALGIFLFHSFGSGSITQERPLVESVTPLQPAVRQSNLIIPINIPLETIAAAANAAAPPHLSGTRPNPAPSLFREAQIDYMIDRSPLTFTAQGGALSVGSELKGNVHVSGQGAGSVTQSLGGLIGGRIGSQLQNLRFDQTVAISGSVHAQARPQLMPDWHIAPRLTGKVTLKDVPLTISGVKLNIARELQPLVNQALAAEIVKAEETLRGDDRIINLARQEWGRLCLSKVLPTVAPGAPALYVEVKPVAAVAAQPVIDAKGVHLLLGLRAQTRILPEATQPECPFPSRLEILPENNAGGITVALPIDVPFKELNRLLSVQLAGKTYPQDQSGPATVTIRALDLTPSGKRLLLALKVTITEKKFFGLSADGEVYLWGRPELDKATQSLKLVDITLDVKSQAAFGLLGAAASAAAPYITSLIAERAQIDLKPFAADAKARIAAAARQVEASRSDVKVNVTISDLNLQDIAFDATILRVTGEARGQASLSVISLPAR